MPGTTRYSATFDRPYEEEDRVDPPPTANNRRSRSLSWQANTCLDGRPYTPLGGRTPTQRSSSTDSGPSKVPDRIPTRTVANTAVKAHNNPFQFVKVGSCSLYKKAEEQLKKTKDVKKQDVLKEEEEDWQSNLDSWKSRRRKMSEDVFRRQEEIKQFEMEEQISQVAQKKTKTFSEMVESRAHRGRTLSLCLLSSPLEFQDWEYENKNHKNGSCSTFTDESEENSTVNSEDEGVSLRGRLGRPSHHDNQNNHRTNGDAHIEQNGSKLETHNGDYNKLSDLTSNNVQMKPKEGSYIDSGLESISSSHRAGDTPDSGSDFSQDSNSSIDCESPRTGVNILEEFSSKSLQMLPGQEITVKLGLTQKSKDFGFTFLGGKDAGQVYIASVLEGSKAETSGIQLGDQIITIDGIDVSSKKHTEIVSMVQKGQEKGEISLILWRHTKTTNGFKTDEKHVDSPVKPNKLESQNAKSESPKYEKSIESENEMYVDDFEELQRQSQLLTSNNKSEKNCTNSQAQSNGNMSSTPVSSNKESIKTSSENSSAHKLKENIKNGIVGEQNKNEKIDSELNTENQKKNIIKVKRVRKKGVYALDVSGTSNQIPPEAIPANSLFPLSPVTELPSPAEETKTMSSALSSNPTTPVSNYQNGILLKETLKEADAKISSSTIKENKTSATTSNTVSSKTTDSSIELKGSSLDKVESKADSTNVPSSPPVTKNKEKNIYHESLQDEKPKIPSSPKKIKVKVKKASTSEQASFDSSQVAKEVSSSSAAQASDLSAKQSTTESQPKKELKSGSFSDDKQIKMINKSENMESSQKRENSVLSAGTSTVIPDAQSTASTDKIKTNTVTASDKTKNLSLNVNAQNQSVNLATTPPVANVIQPKTPQDEKSKPPFPQKKEKIKPKNTNSQKVNSPAKQNEDVLNSNNDSLNIVFQSQPKNTLSENHSINVKNSESNNNKTVAPDLAPDIPPVEKVAEEMEKLILEQLEEEERAKELASELQAKNIVGSPEHLLTAPPKLAEPPKEKPPPPPLTSEGSQKDSSLKRVNSTKRIKKEIHKRRSNFLGIDNADENIVCNEPTIPPPPALEEILKAEMELDRQSRLKIGNASTERLTMEEKEIMQKEREIIESLESEERQKHLLNGTEDLKNVASSIPSDMVPEEDRILCLKNERKRIETERFMTEEQQQLHLLEEKQLREREEFIRKQEASKSTGPHSDSSLSVAAKVPNNLQSALSSFTETQTKVSLSATNGDGKSLSSNSSEISENKSSECDEKDKVPQKPAVPPKPLKKKEAIRKERERLRQEQEALQREREEHRRKLVLEQEELMKHQNTHGTLGRKFFTVAVVLTVIPLSLYYLFSCVSKMHA